MCSSAFWRRVFFFNGIFLCIYYVKQHYPPACFVCLSWSGNMYYSRLLCIICQLAKREHANNLLILFFSCCRGSVPDKMSGGEEGEREEVLSKKEKRRETKKIKQLEGRLGAPEKWERERMRDISNLVMYMSEEVWTSYTCGIVPALILAGEAQQFCLSGCINLHEGLMSHINMNIQTS